MADETLDIGSAGAAGAAGTAGTDTAVGGGGGSGAGAPSGQDAAGSRQGAGAGAGQPEPFFSRGDRSFKDSAELTSWLDEQDKAGEQERLNHDSYQRMHGKLRTAQRQHQEAVQRFEQERGSWSNETRTLQAIRKLWNEDPQTAQQIANLALKSGARLSPVDQQADFREQIKREALEAARAEYAPFVQRAQAEAKRTAEDKVIEEIIADTAKYPHGVDREAMRKEIDDLDAIPSDDMERWNRAFFALVARANQKAAAAGGTKPGSSMRSNGTPNGGMLDGGSGPNANGDVGRAPLSLEESVRQARKALGVTA